MLYYKHECLFIDFALILQKTHLHITRYRSVVRPCLQGMQTQSNYCYGDISIDTRIPFGTKLYSMGVACTLI